MYLFKLKILVYLCFDRLLAIICGHILDAEYPLQLGMISNGDLNFLTLKHNKYNYCIKYS